VTAPLSEIAQQRTIRLVRNSDYKPPVLRALVDSDEERQQVENLEGKTSQRLLETPLEGVDYKAWGHTMVSAAFAYRRRPGGNRFNDENRGAWYAGFDDRTSLTEVAFHKTRELGYIDYYYDDVQYRALHASFIGRFHDIRNADPIPRCLHPDIAVGYPSGQALANELIEVGSRGLIYPSVRHRGGICIVAFRPNVVQDVAPGASWRIVWNGSPHWAATPV
jgi:RES domain